MNRQHYVYAMAVNLNQWRIQGAGYAPRWRPKTVFFACTIGS